METFLCAGRTRTEPEQVRRLEGLVHAMLLKMLNDTIYKSVDFIMRIRITSFSFKWEDS